MERNGHGRTGKGQFTPGHRLSTGRKPNGVAAALRRLSDPEAVAMYVLSVLVDPTAPRSARQWAAEFIADRIDGKPVSQNLSIRVDGGTLLEEEMNLVHWDSLSPAEQAEQMRLLALDTGGAE
jgi:hypothetical protein